MDEKVSLCGILIKFFISLKINQLQNSPTRPSPKFEPPRKVGHIHDK